MCRTMKELQTISERIYELEQKKAKKKIKSQEDKEYV